MTAPSKAEELWAAHTACGAESGYMIYEEFLAALREYGAAVRARDAEIAIRPMPECCGRFVDDDHSLNPVCCGKFESGEYMGAEAIAAAIAREPLP